jgi:hypothetical protein
MRREDSAREEDIGDIVAIGIDPRVERNRRARQLEAVSRAEG